MEQLRLGLKNWLEIILKPILLREILNDIKKIHIRVWNLRFSITFLVLFCMILQLHITVGRINIRIANNNDQGKDWSWKNYQVLIFCFLSLLVQRQPNSCRQSQNWRQKQKLLDERDLTIELLVMRISGEAEDNACEAEEGG